jgi:hydrogenase small subunit
MAAEPVAQGVEEVHILWISEGMSCDGDSVSITAAGQPSIEDVLLGAIPGLPKVHLHNKVLSPTLGGEELRVESLELEDTMEGVGSGD